MTLPAPFGLEMPAGDLICQWVLRLLAVVGGAAVGGFGVRLIAQGLSRLVEVLPEYPAVYRVHTPDGPRNLKFEELTGYLLEQKKAAPPLTGIRVSADRSDPNAPAVTRLTEWAGRNNLNAVTPPSS